MILESIAGLSLLGFASSNALETALMTMSLTQEKRMSDRLTKRGYPQWLALAYREAFRDWKRYPTAFLMAILIFNTAFSMLWCVTGLSRLGYAIWAPLVIGLVLFLAGEKPKSARLWRSFVNSQAPHRDTHAHLYFEF